MRSLKNEDKVMMSPMFPRLNVNDTEKGGPKAPPRNKMALNEQLSIPSPRFSSGLSVPTLKEGGFVPSIPLSIRNHRSGFETNGVTPSRLVERHFPSSPGGMKLSNKITSQEGKKSVVIAVPKGMYEEDASKMGRESHPNLSLNGVHNGRSKYHAGKQHVHLRDFDREDEVSGTCVMGSISALDMSPDDVVRIIGKKQFWKARSVILNQQRIFAVQVFELHRLIKVQKVMAKSSDILLEEKMYVGKASLEVPPKKKALVFSEPKNHPQKSTFSDGVAGENAMPQLPLPSFNAEPGDGHVTANKPSLFHFPIPGNQLLVPIISPSEGLVYKPVTGPYPPTSGFITPMYNGCGPVNYSFPQFGLPVMKSSITDINITLNDQISPDMPSQISQATTHYIAKFQAVKESEVQGSTASSPMSDRVKETGILPLFPTEPSTVTNEEQPHVIKVVPHARRMATESAARIFQCIQEERKLLVD